MLNVIRHDGPGDVPLLVAHGLFGSARNWGAIGRGLSETRTVLSVDMRNHGQSPRSDDHSYTAQAQDLAEVIDAHGGVADVLGHSMGGKAAMVLAHTAPARVRTLVVVDIAPVSYEHSQGPVVEALRGIDLDAVTRRSQADAQLSRVIDDPRLRAFLLQSLDLSGERPRWLLNLDALGAEMDRIMGFPDLDPAFDGPMTLIRGGASDYARDERLPALRALFPQAAVETLSGRGHWPHAEDPGEFESLLRRVLP